jgi:hypothetical protein
VVSNVTPGVFFYYAYVTAPSTTFTVDILQTSSTPGFKLFNIQTSSNIAQVFLWSPTCNKVATGVQVSLGQARVTLNNAVPGRTYVISVKYDSKSVIGSPCSAGQIANYNFTARVNSTAVPGSSIGLLAKPSNCVAIRTSLDPDEMPAVVAFPNPTAGDLNLYYEMQEPGDLVYTIYDMAGSLILEGRSQHETPGNFQVQLPLASKSISPGVYFLRVVRKDQAETLRIVIAK